MWLILLSLGSALLFFLLTVLITSYAIFLWESERINNLARSSDSGEVSSGILTKNNANRGFTSLGFKKFKFSDRKKKVSEDNADNSVILMGDEDGGENKYMEIIKTTKDKFLEVIKKVYEYLINLYKSSKTEEEKLKERVAQQKQEEIDEVVERVARAGSEIKDTETVILEEEYYAENDSGAMLTDEEEQKKESLEGQKDVEAATLNIAGKKSSDPEEMSVFEKLEARVLSKLKGDGLDNYDIWLELGDLYLKFGEKEKAREIFALVLKHADGNVKEMARNKLIGLN